MPAPGSSDPAAVAETAARAEDLARSAPERAERLAQGVLAGEGDAGAHTVALRALGLVRRGRGDFDMAHELFRRSIELATKADLPAEAAFGLVLSSSIHAIAGRHSQAIDELEAAIEELRADRFVSAVVQLGSVKLAAGDALGSLEAFESIESRISEIPTQQQTIFLMNHGTALLSVHRPLAAVPMFQEVIRLRGGLEEGGPGLSGPLHHLARAHALSGATPEALACFRQIDVRGLAADDVTGLVDRASVLLAAGLVEEAEQAAARARHAAVEAEGYWVPLAPLIHAETLERVGAFDRAATAALEAAEVFDARSDSLHGDIARSIAARCDSMLGKTDRARLANLAERLSNHGAQFESMRVSLHLARAVGPDESIRPHLELVAESETHGFEDGALRAEAVARLARLDNDLPRMRAIVDEALDDLADWRAALGSTELTATSARLSAPLADLAIADGLERGDAQAVLVAAERLRVSAVVSGRSAPQDPEVQRLLDRLRSVMADTSRLADDSGRPALEAEIRALARIRGSRTDTSRHLDPDQLLAGLGDVVLVEFVDHHDQLIAVVFDGSLRLIPLSDIGGMRPEIDSLRFAMERLSSPIGSTASRDAFRSVRTEAARRLSQLLLEPLELPEGDHQLVIVPSNSVASVPWAALDPIRRTVFSVAPSAQMRNESANVDVLGESLVVGLDDPPSAIAEARDIAKVIGCQPLIGSAATVGSVLDAMEGAGVVHLACHGRFRVDNPLMSSVAMADGPLTVYDIERLERAPGVIVMSACEIGRSARTPGEGLMGMSASLMAAGTVSFVASSTVVSDEETRTVMVGFHRALSEGRAVAEALRDARIAADGDADGELAATSFVCLGV